MTERRPVPGATGSYEIRFDEATDSVHVHLQSWTATELTWKNVEFTAETAYRFFKQGLLVVLAARPDLGDNLEDPQEEYPPG